MQNEPLTAGPVPADVRKAVALMRGSLCRPLVMADLLRHCGVAERTLTEHFRAFLLHPPIAYLRRLRLAAARETLLTGEPGLSVTEVANRYLFNHAGRFSAAYKQRFGESPSATLRRAQSAARPRGKAPTDEADEIYDAGRTEYAPGVASREKPSIAVLLGAAPGHGSELRRFAETVAEAIAADLSSIRAVDVMLPTTSQAAMRDKQRLVGKIGARYLLTGSILREGTRLRFVLRLTDTATARHVWGDSFDGDVERPVALQDRIVGGVRRGALAGIRGAEIDRAFRRAPRDLDAHGLAMRALPLLYGSTPDGARAALDVLERAIEIDPDYGLTTALAAWGHGQLVMYNGTSAPAEAKDRARRLALRAAVLDDDDPLALTARCAVHMTLGEFDVSDLLASRALASDPALAWAWSRSGWLHAYRGESGTAIQHFREALRLDPTASRANVFAGIGSAHFSAERYAAAAACLRYAIRLQPGMAWVNRSLSVSYARLGEPARARESFEALRRFQPDLTVSRVVTAVPFRPDFLARLGDGLSALGLPP